MTYVVKGLNKSAGSAWRTFSLDEWHTKEDAIDSAKAAAASGYYDRILVVDSEKWSYRNPDGPGIVWES